MAAQLSWSLFGTPGSTRPLGPAKVWEDHADVRERAELALYVADVWGEPVVRQGGGWKGLEESLGAPLRPMAVVAAVDLELRIVAETLAGSQVGVGPSSVRGALPTSPW